MATSLKISNVQGNELELIQRLKKVQSPGKKTLLANLSTQNWFEVYKELLFRIELYASEKVLNYPKGDLNKIVMMVRKIGYEAVAAELVKKHVVAPIPTKPAQDLIDRESQIIEPDHMQYSAGGGVPAPKLLTDSELQDKYHVLFSFYEDEDYFTGKARRFVPFAKLVEIFEKIKDQIIEEGIMIQDIDEDIELYQNLNPTDTIIEVIGIKIAEKDDASETGQSIGEAIDSLICDALVEEDNTNDDPDDENDEPITILDLYNEVMELTTFHVIEPSDFEKIENSDINNINNGDFQELVSAWKNGDYDEFPTGLLDALVSLVNKKSVTPQMISKLQQKIKFMDQPTNVGFSVTDLTTLPIRNIAVIIKDDWGKVSPHAQPYLDAMRSMRSINDNYGDDSGKSVVMYFLSNAQTWKGETAKLVKAELNRRYKSGDNLMESAGFLNLNESFKQTFAGVNLFEATKPKVVDDNIYVIILHVGEDNYLEYQQQGFDDASPEYNDLLIDSIDFLAYDSEENYIGAIDFPNESKFLNKKMGIVSKSIFKNGFEEFELDEDSSDLMNDDAIGDRVSVPEGNIFVLKNIAWKVTGKLQNYLVK